jgi:carboxymethylenebutenolidase
MIRSLLTGSSLKTPGTNRREVIKVLMVVAGTCAVQPSWAAVGSVILSADATVSSDVSEDKVQYRSGRISLDALLVTPKSTGPHPAVILIHPASGLDDHTKDIARELAAAGYAVLAPDFSSRPKASSNSAAKVPITRLNPELTLLDAKAAYSYLQSNQSIDSTKISVIGLGWGGWRAIMLAESVPGLHRVVIYYAAIPPEGLENVRAPIMGHFAENDFRTTGNVVWAESTFKELGKSFVYTIYPDTDVEFLTKPTSPKDIEAAKESWKKTLDFLGSPS